MGRKDSFSDTAFTSTTITAIAVISAKNAQKKILKFSMRAKRGYLRSPCSDLDDFYSFGILRTQGSR